MKLPVLYNFNGRRLSQRSNSEEGNQVFSSEMAYTDPTPLVHHSFKPNGLYDAMGCMYLDLYISE